MQVHICFKNFSTSKLVLATYEHQSKFSEQNHASSPRLAGHFRFSPNIARMDIAACTVGEPSMCIQWGAPCQKWATCPVMHAPASAQATASFRVASSNRLHTHHFANKITITSFGTLLKSSSILTVPYFSHTKPVTRTYVQHPQAPKASISESN